MVGYISDAVANALKNWPALKAVNVIPVRPTDSDSIVINVPSFPAVIIHINGKEGEGNTFIGGDIRQYFNLSLFVITNIINFSFSNDKGKQAQMLDVSDDVIRCIELTELLDDVKRTHDWNMMFEGMETYTTYASSSTNSVPCDVHKITYDCSVSFDKKDEDYNRYISLLKVEADNGINKTTIE